MIAAGATHDFDAALFHGWACITPRSGNPSRKERSCRRSASSWSKRAISPKLARRSPPSWRERCRRESSCPRLGGLAISAAETGRPATVRWVANQLNMLAAAGRPIRAVARFMECSAGLARVGLFAPSAELSAKAIAIARSTGFRSHDARCRVGPAKCDARDATVRPARTRGQDRRPNCFDGAGTAPRSGVVDRRPGVRIRALNGALARRDAFDDDPPGQARSAGRCVARCVQASRRTVRSR